LVVRFVVCIACVSLTEAQASFSSVVAGVL
jgi:hypothetical protein